MYEVVNILRDAQRDAKRTGRKRRRERCRRRENAGREKELVASRERRERERNISKERQTFDLLWRALLYRVCRGATVVVVLHVESDLYEQTNGCRKNRKYKAPLAPLTRAAHTRCCIKRVCVTTSAT